MKMWLSENGSQGVSRVSMETGTKTQLLKTLPADGHTTAGLNVLHESKSTDNNHNDKLQWKILAVC